jgi:NIMA (never in mitosis gene a)-related kinase 6
VNEAKEVVALKRISIFEKDSKEREKCLTEVNIMRELFHPNIIRYLDSFVHVSELIIVTGWAEKGDLKKVIKEKQAEEAAFE